MNSDTDNRLRKHIGHACLQLPCPDLDASLRFFTERLGFVVEQIVPADAPRTALLSGHGMNLRLRAERAARPAQNRICIQLSCDRAVLADAAQAQLVSPCGVRIELIDAEPALQIASAEQADRKRVEEGKRGSGRVEHGWGR